MSHFSYTLSFDFNPYMICELQGPIDDVKREVRKTYSAENGCLIDEIEHLSLQQALDADEPVNEQAYKIRLMVRLENHSKLYRFFFWLRALTDAPLSFFLEDLATPVSSLPDLYDIDETWSFEIKEKGKSILLARSQFVEPFLNQLIEATNNGRYKPDDAPAPEFLEDRLSYSDYHLWPDKDKLPVLEKLEEEINALKCRPANSTGLFRKRTDENIERIKTRMEYIEKSLNLMIFRYTGRLDNYNSTDIKDALREIRFTIQDKGEFIFWNDPRVSTYSTDCVDRRGFIISSNDLGQYNKLLANGWIHSRADDGSVKSWYGQFYCFANADMPKLLELGKEYDALSEKLDALEAGSWESFPNCSII